jgi:hypothetical protein
MKHRIFFLSVLSVLLISPFTTRADGQLTIGQIQASGQTADDEFVEILNPTDAAVDIGTWSIQYKSASGTTFYKKNFIKGTSIADGGKYIICGKDFSGVCDMKHSSFSLSSAGGTVFLVANQALLSSPDSAAIVDQKTYLPVEAEPPQSGTEVQPQPPADDAADVPPTVIAPSVKPQPLALAVTINELMSNPDGGDEWIELFNGTGYAIDLIGWTLADGTGRGFITLDGLIQPQNFKLIELASAHLNNDGDLIILRDADKKEIDSVAYGDWDNNTNNAPLGELGVALARVGDGRDTNLDNSDFSLTTTATPGSANVITSMAEKKSDKQLTTKFQISGEQNTKTKTDIEKLIELLQGKDKIIIIENLTINTGTESKLAAATVSPAGAAETTVVKTAPKKAAAGAKTTATKTAAAKIVPTATGMVIVPPGIVGKDICVVREESRSVEVRLPKDLKTQPVAGDLIKASGAWSTAKTLTLPRLLVKTASAYTTIDHDTPPEPTPIAMSELETHIGELVTLEAPIVEKQPTRFRLADGDKSVLIKSALDAVRGDKVSASGLLTKNASDFLLTPLVPSDLKVIKTPAPPPSLARKVLPYGIAIVPAGLLATMAYVGKRMKKKKKGGESP